MSNYLSRFLYYFSKKAKNLSYIFSDLSDKLTLCSYYLEIEEIKEKNYSWNINNINKARFYTIKSRIRDLEKKLTPTPIERHRKLKQTIKSSKEVIYYLNRIS